MEHLWVVEFRPGNASVVPEPRFWPDLSDFDIVSADEFRAVVRADRDALEAACRSFPYIRIAGHPADGRWVAGNGAEVYIVDGAVVEDEREAWNALGLDPGAFHALTWDDVDDDVVRDYVPIF